MTPAPPDPDLTALMEIAARGRFFADGNFGAWDYDWAMKLAGELADAVSTLLVRLAAAEARARPDDEPVEPGAFEGDTFFGDSAHTTRATHRWTNGAWKRLPSDEEVLVDLLGKARLRANTAEAALTKAAARVAVLEDALQARPFAVGDQVIADGDKAKVIGLDRGWVWLAWHKGGHTTRAVETVRHAAKP